MESFLFYEYNEVISPIIKTIFRTKEATQKLSGYNVALIHMAWK